LKSKNVHFVGNGTEAGGPNDLALLANCNQVQNRSIYNLGILFWNILKKSLDKFEHFALDSTHCVMAQKSRLRKRFRKRKRFFWTDRNKLSVRSYFKSLTLDTMLTKKRI
jgi:hypothetical protein